MTDSPDDRYQSNLALYDKVVAAFPHIDRKGKNNPYTSHNSRMFSFFSKEGVLAIRLPKDEQEAFLEKYDSKKPISYGAVMKEYVEIPQALLEDTAALIPYLEMSYSYISSLKPKKKK